MTPPASTCPAPASTSQAPVALSVLVATCDRLEQLKCAVDSILKGVRLPLELIVVDGGSTDGTVEYLRSTPGVTPVLQGRKLGPARSYNEAWAMARGEFTCWLSDDTELVPGALDAAVAVLRADPGIGMVGLKTRDTLGPWVQEPYVGGISEYGVLNCNHGVLRLDLLRAVGCFTEAYKFYFIDPDLTAKILCAGRRVVMTRQVSVLHHRAWSESQGVSQRAASVSGGVDNAALYREFFRFLATAQGRKAGLRSRAPGIVDRLYRGRPPAWTHWSRLGLSRRDVNNLLNTWFISPLDPLLSLGRPYHLTQALPQELLAHPDNPFRALACEG